MDKVINFLIKAGLLLILTVLCSIVALFIPFILYSLWGFINPETEVGRILLVGIFLFLGGSASLSLLAIGVLGWLKGLAGILTYRF